MDTKRDVNGSDEGLTRRQAIVAGLAGTTALAAVTSSAASSLSGPPSGQGTQPAPGGASPQAASPNRLPVVYLPHGGGPWPFVEMGFPKDELNAMAAYLRSIRAVPKVAPKALLVISAHWEESVPTVMNGARPPMLYDYYGFPPESYKLQWPAPGDPQLAAKVQKLLSGAGFATAADAARGFDHGTFVPLKLAYPDADIPTVQLSLKAGLDPAEHLAMGRALAPLRDEGVFIVGSGMSYHNMRGFRDPQARVPAEAFDGWLRETATLEAPERDRRLTSWTQAPSARQVHPREEHLLPLMVIAGAAGADRGSMAFSGTMFGMRLSGYHFG
jgi:aromatic ring-opening dioxygenase catalytic subunit (LigB family)